MSHVVAFARALGSRGRELTPAFESRFDQLVEEAFSARGDDVLPSALQQSFVESLGALALTETQLDTWLEKLRFDEALLVFLASRGDEAAVRQVTEMIASASSRVRRAGTAAQELASLVTHHLLVPAADERPRILTYSARGSLMAWLQMVCRRKAIDLSRGGTPPASSAEEIADSAAVGEDPELDLLKLRYADGFNRALEKALQSLPAADANLLYLTSVKRVPLAATARMEGVSVRTLQRRVARIRADVLESTRQFAGDMLGASDSEVASLLGLVQSQLEVTLHRVLAPADRS